MVIISLINSEKSKQKKFDLKNRKSKANKVKFKRLKNFDKCNVLKIFEIHQTMKLHIAAAVLFKNITFFSHFSSFESHLSYE